ncbi:LEAF RUST 10 DISEASE-RESISTANCE LOCUS RECEPTOR-LIKE PROTEIN KINASE-like 2.1 [Pistacia vera]|uniref:LEAF RUST 10 DISEASE-RESISTANCE LOCUS RECEPTOR-LIKE PROTEIN KINASE-like 2.1 n=1 Tax=Pistacia vera TaxID=55513 RepID=UPI00126366E8|nr:LEAF RUST 10 DISEASE-RESISTANCE LOCUS RECEPTOR-LIKE PROTEIN KINASE-like 2.1 [Pistacia vera]
MARLCCVLLFVVFRLLLLGLAEEEKGINKKCPSFSCGLLGEIGFPFSNRTHPECGLCIVDDCDKSFQKIQLGSHGPQFYVSSISQDNMVTVREQEYPNQFNNSSCGSLTNLSLPITPFLSFENPYNQNIFRCPLHYVKPTNSGLVCNDSKHLFLYYLPTTKLPSSISQSCSLIPFHVIKTQHSVEFYNLSTNEFALEVNVTKECHNCFKAGGQCQTDGDGKFNCSVTVRTGDEKLGLKLGIGLGILVTATSILVILAFYFWRKLSSQIMSWFFWKKKTKNHLNIEAFLRNHGSHFPKRYSYSDIIKVTNSFRHKLGQGGYGGVYKGRLLDGRYVAVKNLIDSKGNGEEFINEVASISRTSHVNIVTLLGFCFEGRTRALIYEFMSNGSLDKFIDEKNPLKVDHQLKWRTLYQIVVGIARGLEYLHRGCNIRILHFDIKPHNILLNENFCPKISDFGLAKICPQKESIISMTGAHGTIGYIAPEVFSRNFGAVSYKSDVYSYGMMVIEMTGGRQNNNVGVDNSSELYFPQWIYQRLEVGEELGLLGISNEEDKECVRKMIIVSLWCIQTNPSNRPTMSRVVEMLEGSINSLQIPPKPFLSSPGSAPRDSSINLLS